jgi:hypothetical protein
MVDVSEFLKDIEKRKKRSVMEIHYDALLVLQSENCTLEVMQEFLKQNNVTVSKGAISKFLKRREENNETLKKTKNEVPIEKESNKTETKQTSFEDIQKKLSNFKRENEDE